MWGRLAACGGLVTRLFTLARGRRTQKNPSNGSHWTPLASVLNANGTAQIIDTATNSLGQRFYRALLP